MLAWIGRMGERLPMPIALHRIREYASVDKRDREELRRLMDFEIPKLTPMNEDGRRVLEEALAQLRALKAQNAKLEE